MNKYIDTLTKISDELESLQISAARSSAAIDWQELDDDNIDYYNALYTVPSEQLEEIIALLDTIINKLEKVNIDKLIIRAATNNLVIDTAPPLHVRVFKGTLDEYANNDARLLYDIVGTPEIYAINDDVYIDYGTLKLTVHKARIQTLNIQGFKIYDIVGSNVTRR